VHSVQLDSYFFPMKVGVKMGEHCHRQMFPSHLAQMPLSARGQNQHQVVVLMEHRQHHQHHAWYIDRKNLTC
jgi:hypothetical protein